MRFKAEVLVDYPGVHIGVLLGMGLTNSPFNQVVEDAKRRSIEKLRHTLGVNPVSGHPFIASWREMYRSFGTKAADYRPSAEALARRVLKVDSLPRINVVVDAYNAVSLSHLIPMGGFDLSKISGGIFIRYSEGGEEFFPLGSTAAELTYPGEVVYADDSKVLTRRWNYRDCEDTKISVDTADVVLFVDGAPRIPGDVVEEALMDLENLLRLSCGGEYRASMVCSDLREITLS